MPHLYVQYIQVGTTIQYFHKISVFIFVLIMTTMFMVPKYDCSIDYDDNDDEMMIL